MAGGRRKWEVIASCSQDLRVGSWRGSRGGRLSVTQQCDRTYCHQLEMLKMVDFFCHAYLTTEKKKKHEKIIGVLSTHATTRRNHGNILSERSQTWQVPQCRIPFLWKVQNRPTHRDRKQVSGYQRTESDCFMAMGLPFGVMKLFRNETVRMAA